MKIELLILGLLILNIVINIFLLKNKENRKEYFKDNEDDVCYKSYQISVEKNCYPDTDYFPDCSGYQNVVYNWCCNNPDDCPLDENTTNCITNCKNKNLNNENDLFNCINYSCVYNGNG